MEGLYTNLLGTYGPLAVFLLLMLTGIGVPLGEDLITIPAGIFIAHGVLDPWLTAVCAYAGILASDCMWFGLCWKYGTPLLHKKWFKRVVHPRRLLEVKHQIENRGARVIFMSRFIPGSRTVAITAAGLLHLPFVRFVVASASGCVFTVPIQLGLGFAVGKGLGTQRSADLVQTLVGVLILILLLLMVLAWWRQFQAHRKRAPRAKASWLRRFR